MELWIRSQDKTNLIKVEHVAILNNYTINAMSSNWDYDIGTYKTKERALEVLDEIQNILMPKIIVKKDETKLNNFKIEYTIKEVQSLQYDIEELSTYVYEMPEN